MVTSPHGRYEPHPPARRDLVVSIMFRRRRKATPTPIVRTMPVPAPAWAALPASAWGHTATRIAAHEDAAREPGT